MRMAIIERSCKQVSRGVFFSTIIIIASFLPVFMLTGQEGKLFGPFGIYQNVHHGRGCNPGSHFSTRSYFIFYEGAGFGVRATNPINRVPWKDV